MGIVPLLQPTRLPLHTQGDIGRLIATSNTASSLHAIGNTSLVQLRRVIPPDCAKISVKFEWENPTGSIKDRVALAMIESAGKDARLKPGNTIVEYTGDSTGTSLVLICTGTTD